MPITKIGLISGSDCDADGFALKIESVWEAAVGVENIGEVHILNLDEMFYDMTRKMFPRDDQRGCVRGASFLTKLRESVEPEQYMFFIANTLQSLELPDNKEHFIVFTNIRDVAVMEMLNERGFLLYHIQRNDDFRRQYFSYKFPKIQESDVASFLRNLDLPLPSFVKPLQVQTGTSDRKEALILFTNIVNQAPTPAASPKV